ncbi:serine hydrolase domain-containing protein [Brevundimonas sp.]|uniref:serine hydrolase domain-containing protein n=1 Tax=Brevundimonas sp. TaxID=1871086 RepID=UPI0025F9584F|nr:serine hydrolase domain-containing protein [Brevundimonas sp.]
MNRRSFIAASATAAALGPSVVRAQDTDIQPRLEALRAEHGLPALGGAVVTADGLAWSGVSGVRRSGEEAPVTLADRWHLGSNTKAMTAALFARLVEQGRTGWGAALPDLFPDIRVDPAFATVTIEDLMRHRGAILDQSVMPGWMLLAWAGGDVRALRSQLVEAALGAPPTGAPGAFSYGNANYILAGAAIERITGLPWEEAMRREVFEPLGMASAGFGAPTGDQPWGHRAGVAGLQPMDPTVAGSDNPAAMGPAGTVHAGLADYARFIRVFLTDGGGWLSPESVARLTTPVADQTGAYALGWGVLPAQPWTGGASALVHDGSNTMWLARAAVAPARRAAAICVSNAAQPAQPAFNALTQALIGRFPA